MRQLKDKTGFPAGLLMITITVFSVSLTGGNTYLLLSKPLQKIGGIIEEEAIITEAAYSFKDDDLSFEKTTYSFFEQIGADGTIIVKNDFFDSGDAFLIVDSHSLAIFTPLQEPTLLFQNFQNRREVTNYLVQEGDTLVKIADKFNISLNTIIWANNLKSGSLIKPGQELVILPVSGIRHIIKSGDTITNIAKKYQVSPETILAFNNLNNEDILVSGDELIVPGGKLTSGALAVLSSGLKPMKTSVSDWPELPGFFIYPTSGGWNRGILHYFNATDIVNSCGSPIYAAAEGIIIEAKDSGWNNGYGNLVKIQHYNGVTTVYAHLSQVLVENGETVSQGDLIGRTGDTGNSTGCHLHFEVRGAKNPFVK